MADDGAQAQQQRLRPPVRQMSASLMPLPPASAAPSSSSYRSETLDEYGVPLPPDEQDRAFAYYRSEEWSPQIASATDVAANEHTQLASESPQLPTPAMEEQPQQQQPKDVTDKERKDRIRNMRARLRHLTDSRKVLEADLERLKIDRADRLAQCQDKEARSHEIQTLHNSIGHVEKQSKAYASSLAAFDKERAAIQKGDEIRTCWLRRLATIAMAQEEAIAFATTRIHMLESLQQPQYREAKLASSQQRDLFQSLHGLIDRSKDLRKDLASLRDHLSQQKSILASSDPARDRAKEILHSAVSGRISRGLHRRAIAEMIDDCQKIFENYCGHMATYSETFGNQIFFWEYDLWLRTKNYANELILNASGKISCCGLPWHGDPAMGTHSANGPACFDWSQHPLKEYDLLGLRLRGGDPFVFDLKRCTFLEMMEEFEIKKPLRIDLGRPIDYGDFRQVHRIIDEHQHRYMGKVFHLIRGRETDKSCAINMARLSIICEVVSAQFCAEVRRLTGETWTIKFLPLYMTFLPNAPATGERDRMHTLRGPTCMMIEEYIDGEWNKYVDNFGNIPVELSDPDGERVFPALAHWSYEASNKRFIVADIQGMRDGRNVTLTDPSIHTADHQLAVSIQNDMDANYRNKGVTDFFNNHRCTTLCASLGLTPTNAALS